MIRFESLPDHALANYFFDFLHHLKHTYDPQRIGLLRLAIATEDVLRRDLHGLDLSKLDGDRRISYQKTLSQLREVFFIETIRASEPFFNRSLPVLSITPTFELLPQDPRAIASDLRRLHTGPDPRRAVHIWRKMLTQSGASPSQIEYRFMLACEPFREIIWNKASAQAWVQSEDNKWTAEWRIDDTLVNGNWASRYSELGDRLIRYPVGALHEKYRREDLGKAVKPAFGFWLFSLEALGFLSDDPDTKVELSEPWPVLCDMTAHWPELALSFLS